MQQTQEIKNFIYSHYFSDGLRIAFGAVFPSLLLAQFGMLDAGIIISLGALTVSIADGPGPLIHKQNGMLFCILFMFLTALITGFINEHPVLILVGIGFFCFFYSMLNVYGNRASAIGTAALLIMILTIDRRFSPAESLIYALQLLAGGLWYFILSISIGQIRPYRMAQQTLGVCIREVAEYLQIKAGFYDPRKDYEDTYKKLINQQVTVHEQQDNVREILFKTRQIVKESTKASRRLLMVFVDIVDLFEQAMATDYDYLKIRADFGQTKAIREIRKIIFKVSRELKNLSYYITSNERPVPLYNFQQDLEQLKAAIDAEKSSGNSFVLKKILVSIRNIVNRIQKIYNYFNPKQKLTEHATEVDVAKFVSHQDYGFRLLRDNLTLKSSTFRHALRVTIVMLIGYFAAGAIAFGHHSYWILLTILVILKPGFSLTKQRNYQRVIGTFAGGIIGALIVLYIKDQTARFIILLVFMIAAYSFQRLNYIISVLFMTPYVLILFSFIGLGTLSVASERIFDTFVGSLIALIASYFVFPSWEHIQINGFMKKMLFANYKYLALAAQRLNGKDLSETEYKLARKEVFVSSANLGAAFQRMLSEPKSKQRNVKETHNFVVFNHILSSYIATLLSSLQQNELHLVNSSDIKLIKKTLYFLQDAAKKLKNNLDETLPEPDIIVPENLPPVQTENSDSRLITEQLEFMNNVARDIQKVVVKMLD